MIDEKALEAALDVAYAHNELWAKTNGSPTDTAVKQIISAYLAAHAEAGFVEVPVEPTGAMVASGYVALRSFMERGQRTKAANEVYRAMLAKAK